MILAKGIDVSPSKRYPPVVVTQKWKMEPSDKWCLLCLLEYMPFLWRIYPSSPLVDQAKLKLRLKRRERVMLSDGNLWKLSGRWWQVSVSRHRSGAARSLQVLAKDPLQEGVRVNKWCFFWEVLWAFPLFFSGISERSAKTNWSFCGLAKFLRISEKNAKNTIRFFFETSGGAKAGPIGQDDTGPGGSMGIMVSIDGDFMTDLPKVQRLQAMKEWCPMILCS